MADAAVRDVETATLERSFTRFAEGFGVPDATEENPAVTSPSNIKTDPNAASGSATQEAPVTTPATTAANKTAEEGAQGMGGSQVQTANDAGDYSAQSAEVGKQKSETRQSGPEGTPELGSQVQSKENKDQNYTLAESARLAKLRETVKTIVALAGKDPAAAAKFVIMAESGGADQGGQAPAGSSQDPGEKMGETPPSVAEGDAAASEPAPDDTATTEVQDASTGIQDAATQVKLQETIKQREQQMQIDKAVNDELNKVMDEVTGKKHAKTVPVQKKAEEDKAKKEKAEKEEKEKKDKEAKEKKEKEEKAEKDKKAALSKSSEDDKAKKEKAEKEEKEKKEKKDKEAALRRQAVERGDEGKKPPKDDQSKKVPHASIDPDEHPQRDGDPDWTLYDQSKAGESSKPEGHNGEQFADSSERQYKLSRVAKEAVVYRPAIDREIKLPAGLKVAQVTKHEGGGWSFVIPQLGELVYSSADVYKAQVKGKIAAERGNAPSWIPGDLLAAWKHATKGVSGEIAEMVKAYKELIKRAFVTSANDPQQAMGKLAALKKADGSPDDQKTPHADDTTRYEGDERGDVKADDVSEGNEKTLESPETKTVKDEARSTLDRKHTQDIKGSTVAFTKTEVKDILAQLKGVDDTYDGLGRVMAAADATLGLNKSKQAVKDSGNELRAKLKEHGDAIEAGLKATEGKREELRSKMAQLLKVAKLYVGAAKNQAMTLAVMVDEVKSHRQRFARISPAFKLAMQQVEYGHIELHQLPAKMAEYVKLQASAFDAVAKTVNELGPKTARRGRGPETPTRFPRIAQSSGQPADDLDNPNFFDNE